MRNQDPERAAHPPNFGFEVGHEDYNCIIILKTAHRSGRWKLILGLPMGATIIAPSRLHPDRCSKHLLGESVALSSKCHIVSTGTMSTESLSETKISNGFLTVVPKPVRERIMAREGDHLQWILRGEEIIIRVRSPSTVNEIVGMISHGGNAVASKKAIQGARSRVR